MVFLIGNINVFAWIPYETLGVDPKFICHRLNIYPKCTPKKKKLRKSSNIHADAIKEEINKLKEVGTKQEVFNLDWLANTMIVKKKTRKWRVCVVFTDLNEAYSKDLFLIPKMDQLINVTFGHLMMSFLNAFQGYHHTALASEDQENSFPITIVGNFHYKFMSFDLKNVGSTYQRIRKNTEAYIDDMVAWF